MSGGAGIAVGAWFGRRYEVVEELGHGGVGQVYVARDVRLNREVALKVLLPKWASHEPFRLRFLREARVGSALHHPNAIQIFDYGEHKGQPYMVMELLSGSDLYQEISADDDLMPIDRAIEIAYRISDVLCAAHRIPLVHRDLKPDNIFLDVSAGRERIVVLDFGMAFLTDSEDATSGRLTQQSEIGGTPAYMSPEQASGDKIGTPSDVYALGCLLHELIAGAPPFEGSVPVMLSAHLFSPPPSLRALRPNTPSALQELVARMLEKRPSRRPTMEQVRARLLKLGEAGLNTRDRARDASYLSTRDARMVDRPEVQSDAPTEVAPRRDTAVRLVAEAATDMVIGHLRPLPTLLAHGISANGMRLAQVGGETPTSDMHALFEPNLTPDTAKALLDMAVPVVTSCAAKDMDRIAALLRAGVAEVVPDPVDPGVLAKRLWRVIRRDKLRRRKS